MTQTEIEKAIKECEWKHNAFGKDYCKVACIPCSIIIDKGICPKHGGYERTDVKTLNEER